MKLFSILAFVLTASCTKQVEPSDAYMLCVTQAKNQVTITVSMEAKTYIRSLGVTTEFGENKVNHFFIVYPGVTQVSKVFTESASLTKFYGLTLQQYHN